MTTTSLEWRKTIHNTVMLACYKNGLPQIIIDAIDAAYVAGLDAKFQAELNSLAEEIRKEKFPNPETTAGAGHNKGLDKALLKIKQRIK